MCYFFLLGLFFVLILNAFFYANMHSPFLSKIYLSLFYFFNYPTTIGVFSHLMILQNIVQHIHTNENKYVAQSIIGLGICSNSTLTYIKLIFATIKSMRCRALNSFLPFSKSLWMPIPQILQLTPESIPAMIVTHSTQ